MLKKPKRPKREDAAQSALRALQRVIDITEKDAPKPSAKVIPIRHRKNPAAVALGRKAVRARQLGA